MGIHPIRYGSLEEAMAQKPKEPKLSFYTQEEFGTFVVDYIVDSVLPLRHVDTEPFKTFIERIAEGT